MPQLARSPDFFDPEHNEDKMATISTELEKLMHQAKVRFDALTPEQQAEVYRQQSEGYALAEASWPKAKFKWENGVKVYASYEDYCND